MASKEERRKTALAQAIERIDRRILKLKAAREILVQLLEKSPREAPRGRNNSGI